MLRANVVRAERVFGGYAPSATFRMRLANGRRAFFKGSYPLPPGSPIQFLTLREERVYRALGARIARWSPRYLGSFERDGWHVLLLEDVGPATIPPWTAARVRRAAREYAKFHRATLGSALPRWLPRDTHAGFGVFWRTLKRTGELARVPAIAGRRRREAARWIEHALPTLLRTEAQVKRIPRPFALLHFDTRSDNVRLLGDRFVMFDWPFACVGPAEFDLAAFAQGVAAEGGPAPERVLAWYEDVLPLRSAALDASLAGIAGYFADRASRPPMPGLPRLRSIQRRQLKATLPWTARRLGLAEPAWIDAVAD
jgi:Ser/Thr protein kinase RdoA (MazF antagonist)